MKRNRNLNPSRALVPAVLFALAAAPTAAAQGPGGVEIPGPPGVTALSCAGQPAGRCARGQLLTITGENLQSVVRVEFLGSRTRRDDVFVKVPSRAARPRELVVTVPRSARSGPVRLKSSLTEPALIPRLVLIAGAPATRSIGSLLAGGRQRARLAYDLVGRPAGARIEALHIASAKVVRSWPVAADGRGAVAWDGFVGNRPARSGSYVLRLNREAGQAAPAGAQTETQFRLAEGIFPIRGRYRLSSSTTQRFGGGRGHQGTDHFAACGTPLVAWTKGTVQYAGTQGRAGNYLVVRRPDGSSYAYMHLRRRALVRKGERVRTGQRVGYVGDTGSASGCHLHIELWTSPGWYRGGRPFDSLPLMKRLSALD